MMRAAVLYGAEDVRMEDVPIPVPGPGEVLARVDVASIDFTDRKVYLRGHHPMITIPGLFGHEWAGTIVAVGPGIEARWRPGQRVVAANSAPCLAEEGAVCRQCRRGRQSMCEDIRYNNGAFAAYILVPSRLVRVNLHEIPADVPAERVVFTEPYACVLHAVRRVAIQPRDAVVILGAGPMGLFWVIALRRRYGPDPVIVSLDHQDDRLAVARALGANHGLNSKDGNTRDVLQAAIGRPDADVVIESVGAVETHREALGLVGRGGTLVSFGGVAPGPTLPVDIGHLHYEEISIQPIYHHTPADVAQAVQQLVAGQVPVERLITARLPLSELRRALQMVADRTTLRTILIPDQERRD
ncbi:MAG: alcohol dehydrogenase catalytic domain-containing protein [candidate division NC10 bacterium]|nr:alcohol dehydrogenase catalytic domain-containing protein [candidate division NC10 bacterium]